MSLKLKYLLLAHAHNCRLTRACTLPTEAPRFALSPLPNTWVSCLTREVALDACKASSLPLPTAAALVYNSGLNNLVTHLTPEMQVRMFLAQVRPVMSYGCQVWGADFLSLPSKDPRPGRSDFLPNTEFERVQLNFLRSVTGVGKTTPSWCLLDDCSVDTMQTHFARCVLRFWNALRERGAGMANCAAKADVALMLAGNRKCWTYKVCRFLIRLSQGMPPDSSPCIRPDYHPAFTDPNTPFPATSSQYFNELSVDVDAAVAALERFWFERMIKVASGPPDTCAHFPKFATYLQLIGPREGKAFRPHMKLVVPRGVHVAYIRFRLGACNTIAVNANRLTGCTIPRSQRHCPHCKDANIPTIEHEMHVFRDCPRYAALRAEYPRVFPTSISLSDSNVQTIFNLPTIQKPLAEFLFRSERLRNPLPPH